MKFAKFIRIISLAPVMAFVLVTAECFIHAGSFDMLQYVLAVIFLTVIPILVYPLQPAFPKYRDKGREGQRNLAMVFAVLGYIIGAVVSLLCNVKGIPLMIYFTYLISGFLIVLFNKVLKMKASGHACGVAGPVAVAICTLGPWWYFGIAFLVLVFWACLKLHRHSLSQLFIGSLLPVGAMVLSMIISGALI